MENIQKQILGADTALGCFNFKAVLPASFNHGQHQGCSEPELHEYNIKAIKLCKACSYLFLFLSHLPETVQTLLLILSLLNFL